MSLYDDASLIMYPSGYKADKIYSLKPTNGSGDLDFTRSNDTATRVNSDGLIEKVRTNLYTYSQSFADASWLALSVTKVSTSATDPNAGNTAANITWTSGTPRYFYKDFGNISPLTVSFWVKSNGGGNKFRLFGNGTNVFSADFTATSTWTRYSLSFNGSGVTGIGIAFASDNSAADLLVAFAQLEVGDVMTAYIPTTSSAVSVGMLANVPRIDYTGGGCGKLLLEPQRTNLALFSESFDNGAYVTINMSVTANATTSPDGYTNADKIESTATPAAPIELRQTFTLTAQSYVASVYLKQGSGSTDLSNFDVYDGGGSYRARTSLNFATGVLTQSVGTGASVVNVGDGWFRVLVPFTGYAGINYVYIGNSGNYEASGKYAYAYGFQLEEGSYPTSYIPTLSAASTRGADAALTASVPSLIGQTEGVMFVDFNRLNTAASSWYSISNIAGTTAVSYANSVYFYQIPNDIFVAEVYSGNVRQVGFSGSGLSVGRHKIAFGYKANDFVCYIDGVQIGTDTSGSVPAMNYLTIGGAADPVPTNDSINQALLFKTRLTNTQLAELTTL